MCLIILPPSSITPSLLHSLHYSLPPSFTPSFTHSLTPSLTPSRNHTPQVLLHGSYVTLPAYNDASDMGGGGGGGGGGSLRIVANTRSGHDLWLWRLLKTLVFESHNTSTDARADIGDDAHVMACVEACDANPALTTQLAKVSESDGAKRLIYRLIIGNYWQPPVPVLD